MAAARASKVCPQARIPRDIDALTKPELLAAIASAGVGRENERIAQLSYVDRLPQVDVAVEMLLGRATIQRRLPMIKNKMELAAKHLNQ